MGSLCPRPHSKHTQKSLYLLRFTYHTFLHIFACIRTHCLLGMFGIPSGAD
ncbi:unnamed protein product [Staurois parvus]|uniref:Uncharacterized protein n=1 Tax=Staurois parvus TaxID=386267 RepID=A0ABN9GGU1_9NEOB|nr:unnamed protein product [Staurois parvus]